MSQGLPPVLQVAIGLVALAILLWPADMGTEEDFDGITVTYEDEAGLSGFDRR